MKTGKRKARNSYSRTSKTGKNRKGGRRRKAILVTQARTPRGGKETFAETTRGRTS